MNKTVIYVRNKNIRPSDYYRIIQYTKDINAEVIIRSAIPDKIDKWSLNSKNKFSRFLSLLICYFLIAFNYIIGNLKDKRIHPDSIIVIREIFPRIFPICFKNSLLNKCKSTDIIWDFDDSIIGLEISQLEADIYLKYAKKIVVSTPYLKENLPEYVQSKTSVLCTTDGDLFDINLYEVNLKRKDTFDSNINVVWVATANNMPNLLDVIDYFEKAAEKIKNELGKQLNLKVICNREVEKEFTYLNIKNIKWTHDIALEEILESHIGIMPLINNEFALGKAGFKLIQYMSGGLPIIASNVGYNSSILNNDVGFSVEQNSETEWVNALYNLSKNFNTWEDYSKNSRKEWEDKYSYQSHLDFWNELINE